MSPYDYVGSLTQAGRLLAIQTPLGEDVFLLEGMDGVEGLNDLFGFRLRVRSKRRDILPKDLVGLPVSWTLELPGGARRTWSGVVGALDAGPALGDGMRSYVLTARPWLWLFTHTSDCRIFQNKTTQQILETIFTEAKIRDFDFGPVIGPKAVREYCVQYNETDYNFIARLLEEEGWSWWFRHEPGSDGGPARHVLVVSDGAHAWTPGEEPELRFTSTNLDLNDVTGWVRRYQFMPGQAAEADWNFETPQAPVMRGQPSLAPIETNRMFEMYRWGGRFLDKDRADHISRRRIEAHEAGFETVDAESGNRRLQPAQRFRLYGHPIAEENADYAVVRVMHWAEDQSYAANGGTATYSNRFQVVPATTRWVPEQKTPRPRIEGIQTATVVGPPGEEIHTDRYGRIKVKFPWDRYAKGDDTSSCWLRVSQPWGGSGWGSQTIPRIGMEVLVGYLEGDPDKPLVMGVVPNPTTMPSLSLPGHKTRTGFKSSTSPGGAGFNELSFEDQAGAEEMFQHAQKDSTQIVRNNQRTQVGNAYTMAAETLHLTTVQASQVQMTPQSITLQHKGSQIYMDETQIILSFGGRHKIRLSADGVETHSETKVFASQGPAAPQNFISMVPDGIHVMAKTAMRQEAGGSTVEMSGEGIDSRGAKILLNCAAPVPTPTPGGADGPTVGPAGPAWTPEGQGANPGPQVGVGAGAQQTSWQAEGDAWAGNKGSGPNSAKVMGAEGKVATSFGPDKATVDAEATVAGAQLRGEKRGDLGAVSGEMDILSATAKGHAGLTPYGAGAHGEAAAYMARGKVAGELGDLKTGGVGGALEGQQFYAKAEGDALFGDDGRRVGVALGGKASASALGGSAESQTTIPIGWLPGVPDDWTLNMKEKASAKVGGVGAKGGGYAYYDRADERYYAGAYAGLGVLLGAGVEQEVSIGPASGGK
ncbi:type VI secretion system Vgr family protein [Inquilinus limosus]|uniref:type VI secretion system Vgr family protein n=1 Tax=Inquilinus limosus TaxID=171674 RepID=UPI00040F5D5C|nr:type VI secretion system tip protein TssI/VgrG [Inquilinus limosus]